MRNPHRDNTNQIPPFNKYHMPQPQMPQPQQPFGYNSYPGYNLNDQSIPINKLMCWMLVLGRNT